MPTITTVLTDEEAAQLEAADPKGRTAAEIINEEQAEKLHVMNRKECFAKLRRLDDATLAAIIAIYHPDPLPTFPLK